MRPTAERDGAAEPDGITRLGAIALFVAAALWLGKSGLDWISGPPPSTGSEILRWRDAQELPLGLTNELLFFAVAALVPGLNALYRALVRRHPKRAVVGCGVLALALPIVTVALVVHGRLVYPVFGIRASTPETAELLVALYFGAMHAAALLFAGGAFVVSAALRGSSRLVAVLGVAAGLANVAGGYPDHIGPIASLACGVVAAVWWIGLGAWLLGRSIACAGRPGGPLSG